MTGADGEEGAGADGAGGGDAGESPDPGDAPEGWRHVERVTEYETGWYEGGYDLLEQPDGTTKRYYWASLPPAAVVVARDGDRVVFVEQYRPVVRQACLELPAGIVEDGEEWTEAAARELREETGYDPGETLLLASFWCSTGVLRHRRGVVFATDLAAAERDLDGNEFLSVETVPASAALERARAAPANDATLEGLLLAREEGLL